MPFWSGKSSSSSPGKASNATANINNRSASPEPMLALQKKQQSGFLTMDDILNVYTFGATLGK